MVFQLNHLMDAENYTLVWKNNWSSQKSTLMMLIKLVVWYRNRNYSEHRQDRAHCLLASECRLQNNIGGKTTAKNLWLLRTKRPAKFSTQAYTHCERCGRVHTSLYRKFTLPCLLPWIGIQRSNPSVTKHLGNLRYHGEETPRKNRKLDEENFSF